MVAKTVLASVAMALPCLRVAVVGPAEEYIEEFSLVLGVSTFAALLCVCFGCHNLFSIVAVLFITMLVAGRVEASAVAGTTHNVLHVIACVAVLWQFRRQRQFSLWAQLILTYVAVAPINFEPTARSKEALIDFAAIDVACLLLASTTRHLPILAVAACLLVVLVVYGPTSPERFLLASRESRLVMALVVLSADRPQWRPNALAVVFAWVALRNETALSHLGGLQVTLAVALLAVTCYGAWRMRGNWTHAATYIILLIIAKRLMDPTVTHIAVVVAGAAVLLSVSWRGDLVRPSTASALLFCASVYGVLGGSDWTALVALVAWGVPAVLLADSPHSSLAWAVSVPLVAYGAAEHLAMGPLSMVLPMVDNTPAVTVNAFFAKQSASTPPEVPPSRHYGAASLPYLLLSSAAVLLFKRRAAAAVAHLQWTRSVYFTCGLVALIVCAVHYSLGTRPSAAHRASDVVFWLHGIYLVWCIEGERELAWNVLCAAVYFEFWK